VRRCRGPARHSLDDLDARSDWTVGTKPEMPVTVLVVDDQDAFRRAMRAVVGATDGFELIGEAASGEEAVEAAEALSPQIVIMDKRMPGIGGIEACMRLTASRPGVLVLLVSVEDPDPEVAADCGAAAFIRKQDLSREALADVWRERRVVR
jgi:DNA-binding NarL/FixJ family response regulator